MIDSVAEGILPTQYETGKTVVAKPETEVKKSTYYHFYRITNDENPILTGAGWNIKKIDELTPKELERRNIYNGEFIHRFIIPSELGEEVFIRRGNSFDDWNDSGNNELEPLADIKPSTFKDIPGEHYPEAWEIKFPESIDPKDYYVKQEYPKIRRPGDVIGGEPSEYYGPKTIEMGKNIEKMLLQHNKKSQEES